MALTEIPSELSSTPSIVDNGNATAITIGSDESATFAAAINAGGTITGDDGLIIDGGTGNAYISVGSNTGSWVWKNYQASHKLALEDSDGTGEVLNFSTTGAATFNAGATFAGSVGINISPNASADLHVADTSDARIWIEATNGDTMELYAGTNVSLFNRSNNALTFGTNNIERMHIRSDGGVGVGVVPPAFGTAYANINIGTTGSLWASKTGTSFTAMSDNNYHSGSGSVARNSGPGSMYYQLSGKHIWANFASVSAGAAQTEVARMRLEAAGDLTLLDGNLVVAAGHGIDFSATTNTTTTTSSELLDYYEEGAWTPTVAGCSINVGRAYYTRVGNLVTLHFNITVAATDSSGNPFEIGGRPFQGSSANSESTGSLMLQNYNPAANTVNICLYTYSRVSELSIYQTISGSGWNAIKRNQVQSGTAIIGTITFETDT